MEERNLKTFKEYFSYIVIIVLGIFIKIQVSEKDEVYKKWIEDKERTQNYIIKYMDKDYEIKEGMLEVTNAIIKQQSNKTEK